MSIPRRTTSSSRALLRQPERVKGESAPSTSSARRLAAKSKTTNGAKLPISHAAAAATPQATSARMGLSNSSRRSSLSGHAPSSSQRSATSAESQRKQKKSNGKQQDKTIIYTAGGCISAGLLLFFIYLFGSSGKQGDALTPASSRQSAFAETPAGPYQSESEARQALSKAQQMFAEGASLAGDERNRRYRAAAQLCDNVLASKISDKLREEAAKIKYGAVKHMTIK